LRGGNILNYKRGEEKNENRKGAWPEASSTISMFQPTESKRHATIPRPPEDNQLSTAAAGIRIAALLQVSLPQRIAAAPAV
jgi:hypothetical protein